MALVLGVPQTHPAVTGLRLQKAPSQVTGHPCAVGGQDRRGIAVKLGLYGSPHQAASSMRTGSWSLFYL